MSQITAAAVKSLRDRTGAGMMDCKRALTEAGGEEEQAIDLLRQWGAAKAAKRSGRAMTEGVVAIARADGRAGMVAVTSETDFVSRITYGPPVALSHGIYSPEVNLFWQSRITAGAMEEHPGQSNVEDFRSVVDLLDRAHPC